MKTMRRRRFPLRLVKIGTAIFYSARDNTDHRHIFDLPVLIMLAAMPAPHSLSVIIGLLFADRRRRW